MAMTLAVACVAWVAVAIPLCLFVGRTCALYLRCGYIDDMTREFQEVDDGES